MLNKKKNNKGFTLVELLVVIAIIGILAVVAVPALFKNIEKGKVADLEADISAIRSAALSHYADESQYPIDVEDDLEQYIEGLSEPFGTSAYALTQITADDEVKGAKIGELVLEIEMVNEISKSGLSKLEKDLGEKMITEVTEDTNIINIVLISK